MKESGEQGEMILRRMIRGGHEIGNHSYSHPNITKLPRKDLIQQIRMCQDIIESKTGKRPVLFRPPGGNLNVAGIRSLSGTEIKHIVNWSVDPMDWKGLEKTRLWQKVAEKVEPGSIILLHDTSDETITALSGLIDILQAKGFELVTVSELLQSHSD